MLRRSSLPLRVALRAHRSKPSSSPLHVTNQRGQFGTSSKQAEDAKPQSFKSQLYESTQQRLKRERAEQERFSQFQTQSPGGRYAALTFGMFTVLKTLVMTTRPLLPLKKINKNRLVLIVTSSIGFLLRWSLLPRDSKTPESSHLVHYSAVRFAALRTQCFHIKSSGCLGRFRRDSWERVCLDKFV